MGGIGVGVGVGLGVGVAAGSRVGVSVGATTQGVAVGSTVTVMIHGVCVGASARKPSEFPPPPTRSTSPTNETTSHFIIARIIAEPGTKQDKGLAKELAPVLTEHQVLE